MTQINSYIHVIDNSGVKIIKSFGNKKKSIKINITDCFIGSIKKLNKQYKITKLKKGEIASCLLVQNKIYKKNKLSILYKFFNNYCILLNDKFLPLGTRIYCVILSEIFRLKKLYRVINIALKVI